MNLKSESEPETCMYTGYSFTRSCDWEDQSLDHNVVNVVMQSSASSADNREAGSSFQSLTVLGENTELAFTSPWMKHLKSHWVHILTKPIWETKSSMDILGKLDGWTYWCLCHREAFSLWHNECIICHSLESIQKLGKNISILSGFSVAEKLTAHGNWANHFIKSHKLEDCILTQLKYSLPVTL